MPTRSYAKIPILTFNSNSNNLQINDPIIVSTTTTPSSYSQHIDNNNNNNSSLLPSSVAIADGYFHHFHHCVYFPSIEAPFFPKL